MLRVLTVSTVLSWLLLAVLLIGTNPSDAGLMGMLGVFVLGYLSLLGVVTFLLYYGSKLWVAVGSWLYRRAIRLQLSLGRAYAYASVISAVPMMMVGLYSTGGIRWHETALLILFGVIGIFYVARRS